MSKSVTELKGHPIRIGILGTARIAPTALIKPAQENPEVEVTAVAARDLAKARIFAGICNWLAAP